MTNDLTPTQDEALNRAIAEFEGLEFYALFEGTIEYIERVRVSESEEEQRLHYMRAYTRDLNAIVDVVQRWIKDRDNYRRMDSCLINSYGAYSSGGVDIMDFLEDGQPALALCLAFAKAAGIEEEE